LLAEYFITDLARQAWVLEFFINLIIFFVVQNMSTDGMANNPIDFDCFFGQKSAQDKFP